MIISHFINKNQVDKDDLLNSGIKITENEKKSDKFKPNIQSHTFVEQNNVTNKKKKKKLKFKKNFLFLKTFFKKYILIQIFPPKCQHCKKKIWDG